MAEPLFGQILPTVVADFLLRASKMLLLPVITNFMENQCVFILKFARTC